MVLKLWDIDNGKVTHLKYTNSKNESRLVKLKDSIEPDRIPLSDLDKAIELMIRFVSSVKKFDNFGEEDSGKDDNVEDKSEIKAKTKSEDNVEIKPEGNIEDKPYVNIEPSIKAETKSGKNVETKSGENLETKPDINIEPWVKVCRWPKFTIEPWVKRQVTPDSKVDSKPDNKVETVHKINVHKNVETKPDSKVETKSEDNLETKPDSKVETKSEDNVETEHEVNIESKLAGNYDIENGKREIPHEVNEKLDLLLQKDEGRIGGPQFLINKNAGKDVHNSSLSPSVTKTDISTILRGNAATRNRIKERKNKGISK